MFIGVYEVKMDSRKRVVLPKSMFSGIDDGAEFVLVGCGDHCELYTREVWEEVQEKTWEEVQETFRME